MSFILFYWISICLLLFVFTPFVLVLFVQRTEFQLIWIRTSHIGFANENWMLSKSQFWNWKTCTIKVDECWLNDSKYNDFKVTNAITKNLTFLSFVWFCFFLNTTQYLFLDWPCLLNSDFLRALNNELLFMFDCSYRLIQFYQLRIIFVVWK